MLVHLPDF
jgi:hypothetical protein